MPSQSAALPRFLTPALLAVLLCALFAIAAPPPAQAQDRWLDLPAPAGVAVANGPNPGEVVISWRPVPGAAFYRIAWIAAQDAAAIAANDGDWLSAIAYTNLAAGAGTDTGTGTDTAVAANTGTQQHTLTRLSPAARYTFLVGSLRVKTATPAWSLPAEFTLAAGELPIDPERPITVPLGLTVNEPGAFGGYTLWATNNFRSQPRHTYLINSAGQMVHRWTGRMLHCKLLENGNLLATTNAHIQLISPDGEQLWQYKPEHTPHHDFVLLPNGNVLLLLYERKTRDEAIAAGANPAWVRPEGLNNEMIIEVRPIYPDAAEIVWQWSVWDHLIQDYDPSKANFGIVSEHPELIDINFILRQLTEIKRIDPYQWLHANGLDYHPELDQILISARNMSEIWIIDHSTTTAEAAGSTGGNSGQGGDLLYRWGNPQAYRAGSFANQQLFWQHNPYWIPDGMPGAGNILILNNGDDFERHNRHYSEVVEITPPVAGYAYARTAGGGSRYGPAQPIWTYVAANPADFLSRLVSNAQRLPNGNTLIVSGQNGVIFEVTPAGATVWRYVVPLVGTTRLYQGESIPVRGTPFTSRGEWWGNSIYRAYRYPPDYPGLQHLNLTPQGTIELYHDGAE